jgi:hypothetical protein
MLIEGKVEARAGITKSGEIIISGSEVSPCPYLDEIVGEGRYPTTVTDPGFGPEDEPIPPDFGPIDEIGVPNLYQTETENPPPSDYRGNPGPPGYSINPADYLAQADYVLIAGGENEGNPPIAGPGGSAIWNNEEGVLTLVGEIHLPGSSTSSGIIYVEGDIILGDGTSEEKAIVIEGQGALVAVPSPSRAGYIRMRNSENGPINFDYLAPHPNFTNPTGDRSLNVGMLAAGIYFGWDPEAEASAPLYPTSPTFIRSNLCSLGPFFWESGTPLATPQPLMIEGEIRSYQTSGVVPRSEARGVVIKHSAGPLFINSDLYSQGDIFLRGGGGVFILDGHLAARNFIYLHASRAEMIINGDLWSGGYKEGKPTTDKNGITIAAYGKVPCGLEVNGHLFAHGGEFQEGDPEAPAGVSWGDIEIHVMGGAEFNGKIYTGGQMDIVTGIDHTIPDLAEVNFNYDPADETKNADLRAKSRSWTDFVVHSHYAPLHFHGVKIHGIDLVLRAGYLGKGDKPPCHDKLFLLDTGTEIYADGDNLYLNYDWEGPLKIAHGVRIHNTYDGGSDPRIGIRATGNTIIDGDIRCYKRLDIFVKDGNLTIDGPSIKVLRRGAFFFGNIDSNPTDETIYQTHAYDLKSDGAIISWTYERNREPRWKPTDGNIIIADGDDMDEDQENQALWCGEGRFEGKEHGVYLKGKSGTTTTIRGAIKTTSSVILCGNRLNLQAAFLVQKKCYLNINPDGGPEGEGGSVLRGIVVCLDGGEIKIGPGFTAIEYDKNTAALIDINEDWVLNPTVVNLTKKKFKEKEIE